MNDKPEQGAQSGWRTTTFANRTAELRDGMPPSLRSAPQTKDAFENASDPLLKLQKADLKKTEAERREGNGRGSDMVKNDKPNRDLKPGPELAEPQTRQTYNAAWLREYRAARLAETKQDRAERGRERSDVPGPKPRRSQGPSL